MIESISPVLITCPETGEPVETVLRLRQSAFEALRGEYSFRCTRCSNVHVWTREQAWLKPTPFDTPKDAPGDAPQAAPKDAPRDVASAG